MSTAVHCLALTKHYGRHRALDGVTLRVEAGQIFGLLGPNGAGKSTLMRILSGLILPTSGSARILERPLGSPASRRDVGMLPELFRYPAWLTPLEVLRLHSDLLERPWDRREAERRLARVGLEDSMERRVGHFSKGMQQRLGLAVALTGTPRLLLLDEPSSALDPLGRHDVTRLLEACRADGMTVFLNTHVLTDVEHLADTIGLIDGGRLLTAGPLSAVLGGANPAWRIATGGVSESLRAVLGPHRLVFGPDAAHSLRAGDVLYAGRRRDLPLVLRQLTGLGVDVFEVEALDVSLEQWFVDRLRPSTP